VLAQVGKGFLAAVAAAAAAAAEGGVAGAHTRFRFSVP